MLILVSLCLSTARLVVLTAVLLKTPPTGRVTDVSKDHSAFISTGKQSNSFNLSTHFVTGHHPTNRHDKEHMCCNVLYSNMYVYLTTLSTDTSIQ